MLRHSLFGLGIRQLITLARGVCERLNDARDCESEL